MGKSAPRFRLDDRQSGIQLHSNRSCRSTQLREFPSSTACRTCMLRFNEDSQDAVRLPACLSLLMSDKHKVVVMAAYNAAQTLHMTYAELPDADVALGPRLLGGYSMRQGMPRWKFVSNGLLTGLENRALEWNLPKYLAGRRPYRREALESVNLATNSDNFTFDQEIMAQFIKLRLRVAETPVPTRYYPQASSASFVQSSIDGLSMLWLLLRFELHRLGVVRQRQFQSLHRRYSGAPRREDAARS